MKKQWILGLMVLSLFAWVGCGPKSIPSEEQAAQEPIDTQDLNFENNNSNNNNQNNTNFQNESLDAGMQEAAPALDAGNQEDEPTEPVEEPSAGACDNDADESILGALDDDLDGIIENCALGCLLNSDRTTCGAECVENDTNLSTGCSNCFGAIISCTADNCALQCGLDSGGASCAECREANCNAAFETCAGIPAQ